MPEQMHIILRDNKKISINTKNQWIIILLIKKFEYFWKEII